MSANLTSKEVVEGFFTAFGKGDFEGILNAFDPSVEIIAVRNGMVHSPSPFGKYSGTDGLQSFLSNLGTTFDTKAFEVANIVGEGETAFANGTFSHLVKSTNKMYESEWALMCEVKNGKITTYKFYEDSEKFNLASKS